MAEDGKYKKVGNYEGQKKPCPKCSKPLGVLADKCHHCGAKLTGAEVDKRVTDNFKVNLGCIAVFIPLIAIGYCAVQPSAEEKAAKQEATAKEQEQGFHCLSQWDGSHFAVKERTKALLRDPSSFEHVETRISDRNGGGEHQLKMRYRARNGFGGMTAGAAVATINSATCSIVKFEMEK